jgi:hypothetical protein
VQCSCKTRLMLLNPFPTVIVFLHNSTVLLLLLLIRPTKTFTLHLHF